MNENTMERLSALGQAPDSEFSLGQAALLLAALFHPDIKLERYCNHLKKLAGEVGKRYQALQEAGAEETPETRLAALKHTLVDIHGYKGDHEQADHIQNADLVRVIDRGKGGTVALAILYIETAHAQNWDAYGLDLPGYFAVRLDHNGQRLIFDPFEQCMVLQAADLRRITKQTLGGHAELTTAYYEPTSPRTIVIRLQNHIKLRQIETEDYDSALQSVEAMRALAPGEYRLLLDAGVLYARTGQPQKATLVLEDYLDKAPDPYDRQQAALLLQEIRQSL